MDENSACDTYSLSLSVKKRPLGTLFYISLRPQESAFKVRFVTSVRIKRTRIAQWKNCDPVRKRKEPRTT